MPAPRTPGQLLPQCRIASWGVSWGRLFGAVCPVHILLVAWAWLCNLTSTCSWAHDGRYNFGVTFPRSLCNLPMLCDCVTTKLFQSASADLNFMQSG